MLNSCPIVMKCCMNILQFISLHYNLDRQPKFEIVLYCIEEPVLCYIVESSCHVSPALKDAEFLDRQTDKDKSTRLFILSVLKNLVKKNLPSAKVYQTP